MNPKWAEENLQTIRILMERSALYRRALAPIMLFAGFVGVLTAAVGIVFSLDHFVQFVLLWFSAAIFAVIAALLIARSQALKDKEVFWSPPTRRVTQAMLLPLSTGAFFGMVSIFLQASSDFDFIMALVWILFYGFALNAAGFFMPRGIKVFGWFFTVCACLLICCNATGMIELKNKSHWLMGFFFGVLHLVYGVYLYLTEKKNPVA